MTTKHPIREALDYLDRFMVDYPDYGNLLWDILSALRGPDFPVNSDIKTETTVQVRRKAFPLIAEEYDAGQRVLFGPSFLPLTPYIKPTDKDGLDNLTKEAGYHFKAHYAAAIRALEYLENCEKTGEDNS